jgi:malate synthase
LKPIASLEKVEVVGRLPERGQEILTEGALDFVARLSGEFEGERASLLDAREARQARFDAGDLPDFIPQTKKLRDSDWKVAPPPPDLVDRKVEITGPAGDRKLVINALNSGASTFMADFEDSQSPTLVETISGQINLKDFVEGKLRYVSPEGRVYVPDRNVATLIVRPRGLHLVDRHFKIRGLPISGSILDFGLFVYHNAKGLRGMDSGPYLYIPKLESHLEARLWNGILTTAEEILGLEHNAIRVTVLIETLPAAFEMDEILYEMRDRITGLNCGRWDYIFSYVKKLRKHDRFVLPDRGQVTMDKAFLASYVDLLIKTCHRRGAYAIGGMSAYIPNKNDEARNRLAIAKVEEDKEREVRRGHDGTWVAHPGLVPVAKGIFDSKMKGTNQLDVLKEDVSVSREELLEPVKGGVTLAGVGQNVSVGIRYLASWLGGKGCVPIDGLMEDAATSEICRAQLWQWLKHGVRLEDGKVLEESDVKSMIEKEAASLRAPGTPEANKQVDLAREIFERMVLGRRFPEFLTLEAYDSLMALEGGN